VAALFDWLVAQADQTPLPAPACANGTAPKPCHPTVNGEDIRLTTQSKLQFRDPHPELLGILGWNGLAEALAQAEAGDASAFSTPRAAGTEDGLYAGLAIACLEFAGLSRTEPEVAAKMLLGPVIAPHLQGASQTWAVQMGCIGWPVPMTNPPHLMVVRHTPPILLVNATHDPSDSYVWAVGFASQMKTGIFVTREGDGHISYFLPGPSCTRDAMDRFLLTGVTPPANTVCPD
jgi:hypothetical protein